MWIKKEGPDTIGDGIVQVMSGSYLITNKEVIENRLLEELISSDDYSARFDFTELGRLLRHCKHSAIVDTEFGFDFSGLAELIEYAKAQISSRRAQLKPVIYIKGGEQCMLPHLMHNFERVMFDVERPGFLISNNLKEEASATIFFFNKQEPSDTVWQNRLEGVLEAKRKYQETLFPEFHSVDMK